MEKTFEVTLSLVLWKYFHTQESDRPRLVRREHLRLKHPCFLTVQPPLSIIKPSIFWWLNHVKPGWLQQHVRWLTQIGFPLFFPLEPPWSWWFFKPPNSYESHPLPSWWTRPLDLWLRCAWFLKENQREIPKRKIIGLYGNPNSKRREFSGMAPQ